MILRAPSIPSAEAQNLIRATQHRLDDLNEFPAHHLRLKLAGDDQSLDIQSDTPVGDSGHPALVVNLVPEETKAFKADLRSDALWLDVSYSPSQLSTASSTSSTSPLVSFIADQIQKLFNEEKATIAHILKSSNFGASFTGATSVQSVSPELAQAVNERVTRSVKYAEKYHLTFSLFTPGSQPSSWDIEEAIGEYLTPLLSAFAPISNFSVDTQVQLFAQFSPTTPAPEYDDSRGQWTLKQEDLSTFINSAEWPLSPSIGSAPTINFVLYVPAPSQSPLVVKDSQATSWIVPQWGGVAIFNLPHSTEELAYDNPAHLSKDALKPAFLTFSHQLLAILGTPSTPLSLPFRLQSLVRIRAASLLVSASSTMGSLARLTRSLASIPIPMSVASSVSTTLSHLTATCQLLREGRFQAALASARVAEKEAEKSFFEKSMVGQMYFPDEHKVAVYLPLLGPIGVPLIIGLLREMKRIITDLKRRKK